MKVLRIYKRNVLERTRFKDYRFKEITQYIVIYDGIEYKNNHCVELNDNKLRKPFELVLNTRKKKDVSNKIVCLGKAESDKWLKDTLNNILEKNKKRAS